MIQINTEEKEDPLNLVQKTKPTLPEKNKQTKNTSNTKNLEKKNTSEDNQKSLFFAIRSRITKY